MESSTKYGLENRHYVLSGAVVLLVIISIIRLLILQVADNDYKAWADSNAFLKKTLYPSRGMVYDRNGKLLVYNQPAYDVMLVIHEIQPPDTLDFCDMLGTTKKQFLKRIAGIKNRQLNPDYSSYVPQVFMNQFSAQEYDVLQERLYKFPGSYIQNRTIRQYEYPDVALVLGSIGEVNRKGIENDSYYTQGNYSGRTGIEQPCEKYLRDMEDAEILLCDAHGRIKGRYEEGLHDVQPGSDKNLRLSLDMDLQAYEEKLVQNKLGSIVMIGPETGEVLCMVSAPTYDPSILIGRQRGKNYVALQRDPLKPLFNRLLMAQYPPRSAFKPTQDLISLQEGVTTPEAQYTCARGYTFRGGKPTCHGHPSPLNLVGTLATSCNSFFPWGLHDMIDSRKRYPLVQETFEVWKNHMVSMGCGYKLGIDLSGEKRGFTPNSKFYDKVYRGRWNSSTVILVAIGQGGVLAAPLRICNLAATVANRGYYITPRIVEEIQDTPLDTLYSRRRYTSADTHHYSYIVGGIRGAVTETAYGGTRRRTALPDTEICGETGTSENPHGKDRSVFMGFAPYQKPRVVIAVFMEDARFGATYTVPIGELMLEKYLKGEISEANKTTEEYVMSAVILPNNAL